MDFLLILTHNVLFFAFKILIMVLRSVYSNLTQQLSDPRVSILLPQFPHLYLGDPSES